MEVAGKSYLMTNKNTEIVGGTPTGSAPDADCHGLVFKESSTGDLLEGTSISGGRGDREAMIACAAVVVKEGSVVDIWGGEYQVRCCHARFAASFRNHFHLIRDSFCIGSFDLLLQSIFFT